MEDFQHAPLITPPRHQHHAELPTKTDIHHDLHGNAAYSIFFFFFFQTIFLLLSLSLSLSLSLCAYPGLSGPIGVRLSASRVSPPA